MEYLTVVVQLGVVCPDRVWRIQNGSSLVWGQNKGAMRLGHTLRSLSLPDADSMPTHVGPGWLAWCRGSDILNLDARLGSIWLERKKGHWRACSRCKTEQRKAALYGVKAYEHLRCGWPLVFQNAVRVNVKLQMQAAALVGEIHPNVSRQKKMCLRNRNLPERSRGARKISLRSFKTEAIQM